VDPPSRFFRVKGGASFFAGNLWTPNEEHEGQSEGEGVAAAQRGQTDVMKKETVQNAAKKRTTPFFMAILQGADSDTCLDAQNLQHILNRQGTFFC
jgi:hypothetical protein